MRKIFLFGQTYAYSIENFQCNPKNLAQLCEQAALNDKQIFDFEAFFKDYSKAYYLILLYILAFKTSEEKLEEIPFIHRKHLKGIFQIPKTQSIENNAQDRIQIIQKKVATAIKRFEREYGHIRIDDLKDNLKNKFEVDEMNALWFLNGHILKDNTERLLLQVTRQMRSYYESQLKSKTYKKEQELSDKINEYHKKLAQRDLPTLFNQNFEKCFIYENAPLLQKIKADIEKLYPSLRKEP